MSDTILKEVFTRHQYLNGFSPFFGGRSSFWSNWSPHAIGPDFDLMDGFPTFMKEIAKEPSFYQGVDKLLHIKPANEIKDAVLWKLAEDSTGCSIWLALDDQLK